MDPETGSCSSLVCNSDPITVENFCEKTEHLLRLERESEVEESRCLQDNISPKLLEKRGVCLTKLNISSRKTNLYGRFVLKLVASNVNRPELPSTVITCGDIVGLHQHSQEGPIDSGIVTKISSTHVSVAFEQSEELSSLGDDVQFYIVKLANDVTYKRLKKALANLGRSQHHTHKNLIDIMFGKRCDFPVNLDNAGDIVYFNSDLDQSQRAAVGLALSATDFAVIHGPPGTGKSTTVVEVIRQCVKRNLKVLACAPSNVAVDNLVLRLSNSKLRVTRLGHPARAMHQIQKYSLDAKVLASDDNSIVLDIKKDIDGALKKLKSNKDGGSRFNLRTELKTLRKELRERSNVAVKQVLKNSQVILSTLTSATDDGPLKLLDDMYFDVVVIDECSQALEVACWIALTQASKCVLAGDHHQLPPTILSHKAAADGLAITLMERLIPHYPNHVQMLTVQYRMNNLIMKWASDELYDGRLTAHDSVTNHLLKQLTDVEDNDITQEPLLFIDTAGCDLHELDLPDEQSKGNEGEADLVAIHTESLLSSGVKPSDIAIISPYNLQVELIRSRLSTKYPDLEIKSVDGYQGREKEAVVISMVRSNTRGEVGFLSENRRMNVAVTRARRQVTLVGDSQTVANDAFLKRLVDYMNDNGVVFSAAEYQQEHDIGRVSDRVLEIINKKSDQSQVKPKVKAKQKPKKTEKSAPREVVRGVRGAQSQVDKSHSTGEEAAESRQEREDRIRQEMTILINDFITSDQEVYYFPASLTSYERMIIHQIADTFNLEHTSVTQSGERQLILRKQKVVSTTDDLVSATDDLVSTTDDLVSNVSDCKCEICGKEIPSQNLTLHRLRCVDKLNSNHHSEETETRPPTYTKTQVSSQANGQNKKSKKKATKDKKTVGSADVLNNVDSDDFDALLAAAERLNSVCNFKKCKTLVKTLGTNCTFCSLRFCISHGMPEAHGCGAAAKTQARINLSREGKVYSGSGLPNKKPNSATRSNLERRLNKKLTDMSDQRRRKQEQ